MNIVILNGGILWHTLSRSVGAYKIAHWIRKHTPYTVQVVDFVERLKHNQIEQIFDKFITDDTHILAISTTFLINRFYDGKKDTSNLKSSNQSSSRDGLRFPPHVLENIQNIKARFPKLRVVTGGYIAERVPNHGVIDESIMSYTESSEDVFLEYVNHIMKGEEPPIGEMVYPSLDRGESPVPRMFYHTARNKRYNIELDDFRFIEEDCIIPEEPLPLDISKGCIFACAFCQYPHIGKTKFDYIRGMEYIEKELIDNYEKFGTTRYYLLDDTFNDSVYKLKMFYDMVQRLPFKIRYTSYLRADLIERFPEMSDLLIESGLRGAYHGIESLHPEASKIIGKGWSGKRAKEYIPKLYHDLWKKQVAQHVNFITGLPKDTKENLADTLKWFQDNDLHSINFNPLGVYGKTSNIAGRHSTQSLFDKDLEKYGFEILSVSKYGTIDWRNGEWTRKGAIELNQELTDLTLPIRKSHSWRILSYEWSGVSDHDSMTLPELDLRHHPKIVPAKKLHLNYYFNAIMSI
jgi:hypothetical protein